MISTAAETANEPLAEIRKSARRERLLDMELRLRRYRAGSFAVLAVALIVLAPEIGWWWIAPMAAGIAGFAVADRFMVLSAHPAIWVGAAWALIPLLLAGAVLSTGGAASPALMWFALPAITLGARFEPRGIAIGTAYILALLLLCSLVLGPGTTAAHHQAVVATVALVLSTVTLSGALVESDRAHRRRSTVDPLTGLFNRNALELRLAELEGDSRSHPKASHALLLCDLDHFKRVNDRLGHAAGDSVLQEVAYAMRANLRAGDSIYRVGGEEILVVLPGAQEGGRRRHRRAAAPRRSRAATRRGDDDRQHRRRSVPSRPLRHRRPRQPCRRGALLGEGLRPRHRLLRWPPTRRRLGDGPGVSDSGRCRR